MKTIAPAKGTNRKQIERFLRECRILAQLDHKNIVGFREVGEADSLIFLAMELVDGPDLSIWLKTQGPDDIRTSVRIVCQMLGGLAHAHAKGFVHRDIKPANILIGRLGDKRIAKLADFGLARVYESSNLSGLTLQGDVGGTPAFMAPEQEFAQGPTWPRVSEIDEIPVLIFAEVSLIVSTCKALDHSYIFPEPGDLAVFNSACDFSVDTYPDHVPCSKLLTFSFDHGEGMVILLFDPHGVYLERIGRWLHLRR